MTRTRWILSLVFVVLSGAVACAPAAPPPPVQVTVVVPQTVVMPQTVVVPPTAGPATNAGVSIPAIPDPVAVEVDAKTTAYLVLDLTSAICTPRKSCVSSLPFAAALLKNARAAKSLVVYSDTAAAGSTILPEVAPLPDEPKVTGRADKFIGTNLDDTLKAKGIKTTVIVGSTANGAVLYTAFGANIRGYTVVVAQDGISSDDAFAVLLTRYQLLNQPGFGNATNKPLNPNSVTLSRSDLIKFTSGPAATATVPPPTPTVAPTAIAPKPTATVPPTPAAQTKPTTSAGGPSKINLNELFPPGPGRDLVLENCMGCHSIAPVLVARKTRGEWQVTATGHRENVLSLSDADYKQLFDYLVANFGPDRPAVQLPPELLTGFTNY